MTTGQAWARGLDHWELHTEPPEPSIPSSSSQMWKLSLEVPSLESRSDPLTLVTSSPSSCLPTPGKPGQRGEAGPFTFREEGLRCDCWHTGQVWLRRAYVRPHYPQAHTSGPGRPLRDGGGSPVWLGGSTVVPAGLGALLWEVLHSCRFRVGRQGQPFRCLSFTWDGDLNDIQILWLNFDGPQPTQLPGGSCEQGTGGPVKHGRELGWAR